jgi:DNA-binding MarR family transcriptional regulator
MKDAGIGRPSTYSRTIEKLEERSYVEQEEGALVPTERGRTVWTEAAPLYARDAAPDRPREELFSPEFTALMEDRLDRIAAGELPAPSTWEAWRDQIRELHEAAQEQRNAGRSTLRQRAMLERLLANAPPAMAGELDDRIDGDRLTALSYEEARDLIARLRDAGVQPKPTEAQLEHARRLVGDLELDEDQLRELTGLSSLDQVETSAQASAAIEELQRVHNERMPPSARQRRFVDSLVQDAGLSDAEAAALVGLTSLDELTGGSEGTASALIDALKERVEAT